MTELPMKKETDWHFVVCMMLIFIISLGIWVGNNELTGQVSSVKNYIYDNFNDTFYDCFRCALPKNCSYPYMAHNNATDCMWECAGTNATKTVITDCIEQILARKVNVSMEVKVWT